MVAQGGIDEEEHEVLYVGCLPVEIDSHEQEVLASTQLTAVATQAFLLH